MAELLVQEKVARAIRMVGICSCSVAGAGCWRTLLIAEHAGMEPE